MIETYETPARVANPRRKKRKVSSKPKQIFFLRSHTKAEPVLIIGQVESRYNLERNNFPTCQYHGSFEFLFQYFQNI